MLPDDPQKRRVGRGGDIHHTPVNRERCHDCFSVIRLLAFEIGDDCCALSCTRDADGHRRARDRLARCGEKVSRASPAQTTADPRIALE
jgi:hypothetical protein